MVTPLERKGWTCPPWPRAEPLPSPPAPQQLRYRSRAGRGVLGATVLGSGVAFLDSTVVNVALPTIQRELHTTFASLQWIVDAYLLTLSALLLVGGGLGDVYGRRRVFLVGLAWFALASLGCGLAPTTFLLIVARAIQGIGAALLVPGSLAVLRSCFSEKEQNAAIGAWAGLSGVTTAAGPLLGGWLVQAVSWRLIFFLNLPLVLGAAIMAWKYVPADLGKSRPVQLDWLGALTVVAGLGGVIFALIEGNRFDWHSPWILVTLIGGIACFAAFLDVEARRREPMLPLSLFRSRQFSGANATTLATYFGFGGAIFLLVLRLQESLHYTPLAAGAALLPITLLMLVLSPLAGRFATRLGYRWMMTVGPCIVALGLLLLTGVRPGVSYVRGVLPGLLLIGLGLSTTVAPLTSAVLASVEPRLAGIASGVNNAVARVAGLLAVALLPLLSGLSAVDRGFSRAMWVSAVLCVVGALCAWMTVERQRAA